jgi:hypothetical protein
MLHLTNGSSVSLAETGLGGEVVCWMDVLQEGPVPAGLELAELTRLRTVFLTALWPETPATLEQRDSAVGRFTEHAEVVLWFEHDLYDQLHLIQILDWFNGRDRGETQLSMICINEFPGIVPFYGLGQLTGEQLATLWSTRHSVTAGEFALGSTAWRAFRSPDPISIEELLRQDTSALPFLRAALLSHLQEFPSVENGLTETQRRILELVAGGRRTFHEFLFDLQLRRMSECRHPLVEERNGDYRLTQIGRDVAAGRADHIRINGVNRWLGGVHLDGFEVLWRWDGRQGRLVRR